MLKEIFGEDISESKEELKEWLCALSKEQLVAEMMKRKESGVSDSDDGEKKKSKDKKSGNKSKGDDS
jgi:hypothetical protein